MIDPSTGTGGVTQDDKNMAMLAAILAIFGFLGPLIIYFIKKDQSKFIGYYALQCLVVTLALIVVFWAAFLVPFVGHLIYGVVHIAAVVFFIMAALAANRAEVYEIPLAGKFAKQQLGM